MKKMTAAVRNENNETTTITSEYNTKADFIKDLNRNGYSVIGRITVEGEKETRKSHLYNIGCR